MPRETTITIPKADYDRLVRDTAAANAAAVGARNELIAERALSPDVRIHKLMTLVEYLKTIADHHTANLHPENTVDLPMEALLGAADLVDEVAGATQRDEERAAVWFERANLIRDFRNRRTARGDDAYGTIGLHPAQLSPDRADVDIRRILINAIRCKACGTAAVSEATHHLAVCKCGATFADGGGEYLRRGGVAGTGYTELSLWMLPSLPPEVADAYRMALHRVLFPSPGQLLGAAFLQPVVGHAPPKPKPRRKAPVKRQKSKKAPRTSRGTKPRAKTKAGRPAW